MSEDSAIVDRVLVIHPVEATRRSISRSLRKASPTPLTVHEAGSLAEGLRAVEWLAPRYVLLDLSEDRSLALDVAREIRGADRRVIGLYNPLLLRARDDEFFRGAARAGVGDFVAIPVAGDDLAAAMAAASGMSEQRPKGKLSAFFGQKGGVGATTLAVNTALVLAGSGEAGEVALCDAALQFGEAADLLGLAVDRDLADLVRDLEESQALSAYLARHEETSLRVLSRPRDLREAETIGPEELSRLLIRLQRRFDHVVVDTAPVLDAMTMAALDLAAKIFLVTEAVTPTVLGTARLMRLLEEEGFAPERLRLVLNRFDGSEGNLDLATVSAQLGRAPDYVVRYDRNLVASVNQGRPLVLSKQKNEFGTLVGQIADDIVRPVLQRSQPWPER